MSSFGTKSKAGLITSIFLLRSSHTSLEGRCSRVILSVYFKEIVQATLGMLNSFASLQKIGVPILFASPFFEKASTPKRKMSHFFIACSAARSGKTITFIPASASSFAVFLPWSRGSTSVV